MGAVSGSGGVARLSSQHGSNGKAKCKNQKHDPGKGPDISFDTPHDWKCCQCGSVQEAGDTHCYSNKLPCKHTSCSACPGYRGAAWETFSHEPNKEERDLWGCCMCKILGNGVLGGVGADICRSSYGRVCHHRQCGDCTTIDTSEDVRWRENHSEMTDQGFRPYPVPPIGLEELYDERIDPAIGPYTNDWSKRRQIYDGGGSRPRGEGSSWRKRSK